MRITAVSRGYSHNGMCAWIALYHSLILLLPCLKDVNTSAVGRAYEMYISSPTSPNHWITFLHLVHLGTFYRGSHWFSVVELWIGNLSDFITWKCCHCTFLSVGFLSYRNWIFHGFLGSMSWSFHWKLCISRVVDSSLIGLDVKTGLLHVWDTWAG